MKAAILSDIHANVHAFNSVLTHAQSKGVDEYWFIGDLFGYGPHAVDVIKLAMKHFNREAWVLGNQDAIFAGYLLSQLAREDAVDVLLKNSQDVDAEPEMGEWIRQVFEDLNKHESILVDLGSDNLEVALTHGCLKDPYNLYIYPWTAPEDLEDYMSRPGKNFFNGSKHPRAIFFGHSHVPALIHFQKGQFRDEPIKEYGKPYQLSPECTLINPGSIGQPRDWDDRAAYAVLDSAEKTIVYYRVEYDVLETAADMQAAHLPHSLQKQLLGALGARPPEEYKRILMDRVQSPGG